MKKKTINIEPYSITSTGLDSNNKFSIVVEDEKKKININIEFWWVQYIAAKLHKTIAEAQERVDAAKKAMNSPIK